MTTTASTASSMWMRIVFALSQSAAVPVLRTELPARAVRPVPDGRVVPMMSELIECPRSLEIPQGEGAYQDEDDDRRSEEPSCREREQNAQGAAQLNGRKGGWAR